MAMMRHYIGNEGETGRQWTSSNFDDRTAHELYIWPFQDAVHAGVVSTMCSYNGLNGTYACADPVSLGKWLHEELNFQGWVLSDFGSVYENTEIDSANAGLDSVIGATTLAFGKEGDRLPSESTKTETSFLNLMPSRSFRDKQHSLSSPRGGFCFLRATRRHGHADRISLVPRWPGPRLSCLG